MKRLISTPRRGWEKIVADSGLMHFQGKWNEAAQYQFSTVEIEEISMATRELHLLSLQAAQHVITAHLYADLGIPPEWAPMIERSWVRRDAAIISRMDLAYDGKNPPKLIEICPDSLDSVIETAWHQKEWHESVNGDLPLDQFTRIHDLLPARWTSGYTAQHIHFACDVNDKQALSNTIYMREMAIAGGCTTTDINMADIGWERDHFIDLDPKEIRFLSKAYPWEWLLKEGFGRYLLNDPAMVIAPAWTILLKSRGILAVMWKLFPNHPNLLAAADNYIPVGHSYLKKPVFGLDGLNTTICNGVTTERREGHHDSEQFVFQEIPPIPNFSGHYPTVGSFLVGDEPAGIGVTEDPTLIKTRQAVFVPHSVYATQTQ